MAGKAVSYRFVDLLAKSVGMNADTGKQVLAEINQLQARVQELELACQDKAPMNHARQQPISVTANEQMHGNAKFVPDNA